MGRDLHFAAIERGTQKAFPLREGLLLVDL